MAAGMIVEDLSRMHIRPATSQAWVDAWLRVYPGRAFWLWLPDEGLQGPIYLWHN